MFAAPPNPIRWEKLRLVRHERSRFDGRFFERHPAHWPLARAAGVFADREDWPEPSEYGSAFAVEPPVRFERAPAKRRRPRGEPVVREDLYDAMIVLRRVVSTRARMWHDFLNALVWATFPRAKLALHTRQHRAIERWLPQGATQLPNARTRELDALALVDEGGVVVLDWGTRKATVLFGHALFEGLVFEQPAMVARSVVLSPSVAPPAPEDSSALVELADAMLAAHLAAVDCVVSPDELPRQPLGDV
jgi:hypothetical protein